MGSGAGFVFLILALVLIACAISLVVIVLRRWSSTPVQTMVITDAEEAKKPKRAVLQQATQPQTLPAQHVEANVVDKNPTLLTFRQASKESAKRNVGEPADAAIQEA